ncbi:MAG: zinc metallopeptidase, partial [Anaerolineales bacterium]
YIAILLGLWFNMNGLLWIGILFFALMVIFSILTLPIEIDASRRGIRLLEEAGLMVSDEDARGSKAVLRAAAMTYLAAAVTSILQLLYYISVAQRRS